MARDNLSLPCRRKAAQSPARVAPCRFRRRTCRHGHQSEHIRQSPWSSSGFPHSCSPYRSVMHSLHDVNHGSHGGLRSQYVHLRNLPTHAGQRFPYVIVSPHSLHSMPSGIRPRKNTCADALNGRVNATCLLRIKPADSLLVNENRLCRHKSECVSSSFRDSMPNAIPTCLRVLHTPSTPSCSSLSP